MFDSLALIGSIITVIKATLLFALLLNLIHSSMLLKSTMYYTDLITLGIICF